MVGLGDHGKAFAGHVLHQPKLPQRLGAIQALGEDAPGELLELGLVLGPGKPCVADVVAGVEVRVVGPHRPTLSERHERQSLAVARHEVQPREDVLDELLVSRCLAFEDHHRGDVHVRGAAVLQVQEGRVQACQAVRVCHRARLSRVLGSVVNARL